MVKKILKNPFIAFLIPGPIALFIPTNAFFTADLITLPATLNGKVTTLVTNLPILLAKLPASFIKLPTILLKK